ncbi:MAG: response regulator [Magnetococcales bacterium]|nr:response regulator [Magnetococcales bacterium]
MDRPLERILYAEDEPDIQEIAILALETVGGFTVKACASGQEILDAAEAFKPDLLLLDVMMPIMDGPTAFQEIRKQPGTETVPVIFMTAKVQPQEVEGYKAMGAWEVIAKPFDPMTLADQIRQIWEKRAE